MGMTRGCEDFEVHPGPIYKGDYLVVQVGRDLLPNPSKPETPQWFIAVEDFRPGHDLPLMPCSDGSPFCKARRYVAWEMEVK